MSYSRLHDLMTVPVGIFTTVITEYAVLTLAGVGDTFFKFFPAVQCITALLTFGYLSYKYLGQRRKVTVRTVGAGGKVVVNPMINERWALPTWQRIKISVNAVTLLPFRFVLFIVFLLLAMTFSLISTFGLTKKALATKPLSALRLLLRKPVSWCFRGVLWSLGFIWITKTGKKASTAEAPVKVAAPHISMFEPIAFMCLDLGIFVAEVSNFKSGPLLWLVQCMQPLLFDRFDPASRQQCGKDQYERATNKAWHNGGALSVFPEGATHNQQALFVFKTGAFRSGVAVQPVAIRMPFRFMDCSWCTAGPGPISLILRAMCQYVNHLELHYLPVCKPTEDDKADARAFANKVQQIIAKHLGVELSNHSIEDNKLLELVCARIGREDSIRPRIDKQSAAIEAVNSFEFRTINDILGISLSEARQYLKQFMIKGSDGQMDFQIFKKVLSQMDEESQRTLFSLMDKDHNGYVDFSEFLTNIGLLNERITLHKKDPERSKNDEEVAKERRQFERAVSISFDMLAAKQGDQNFISTASLRQLLITAFPDLGDEDVETFVNEADANGDGTISRSEFLQFCSDHYDARHAVRDALFPGMSQIREAVHAGLAEEQARKAEKEAKRLARLKKQN